MTDALALWLGERLLIGSIQAVVIVSLVWLTCRLVPRVPAAAQAALWWLVALKLVLVFAPVPAVPLPILPADFERQTERFFLRGIAPGGSEEGSGPGWVADGFTIQGTDDFFASNVNPAFQALILLWLAGVVVQAGRLVLAHRRLRGIVVRALPWTDAETGELATRLGLKRTPPVRLSDEIDGPQVFGLWSPAVLMPADALTSLSANERTMTLCHELMHIRRRDLALGWVPACAERLFFFHPLARLSARHYVTAREAACDAAAMQALGVAPGDYGRMLIRLGIGNARPAIAAGGAPFSNSSLKRRLHMLEHQQPPRSSRRWWWVIAIIGALVIPMQLVARTPEAPQVSGPSFDLYQPVAGALAKVQGKEIAVSSKRVVVEEDPEIYLVAVQEGEVEKRKVEKLKVDKLNLQEAEVEAEKQGKSLEELRARKLVAKAQDEKELRARKLVEKAHDEKELRVRKLIAAAKEASVKASQDKAKTEYFLEKKLQSAAGNADEMIRVLQRLAERLERLAAEQQQLAEELRQLQREPSPR